MVRRNKMLKKVKENRWRFQTLGTVEEEGTEKDSKRKEGGEGEEGGGGKAI